MTTPAPPPADGRTASAEIQVRPADAYQAIRELETAQAELKEIRREAMRLANVTPPSNDEVSRDAAIALGLAAHGRPGSFVEAADLGIARIDEVIIALQRALDGYRATDDEAASSFT